MSDRAAISAIVLTAMGDAWSDSEEYSALPGVVADLLLTSDWLAAEKAKWQAEAWWEGVNDQWKHRPIGARLIEFANPYENGSDDG